MACAGERSRTTVPGGGQTARIRMRAHEEPRDRGPYTAFPISGAAAGSFRLSAQTVRRVDLWES